MAEEKATQDLPELTKNGQKVMEMVEEMTVLELADLVKVMEDKFGVSAAAPMAVAAAPAAGGAEEEEKSAYDVVLKSPGDNKIAVIKVVKEITGAGLMEAKQMVEEGDATIKEKAPKDEANEIKEKLEEAGATVELA